MSEKRAMSSEERRRGSKLLKMEQWVLGEDVGTNYWRMEECSSVFARRRSSQRQWRVAVKLTVLRLGADKREGSVG